MRQKRRILKKYGTWGIDVLCIILACFLASLIRFSGENSDDIFSHSIYYQMALIYIIVCTIYSFMYDWNRSLLHRGYLLELRAVVFYTGVLVMFGIVIAYFLHWGFFYSRLVIVNFAWIDLALTYISHNLYKQFLFHYFRQEHEVLKIIVVAQNDLMETTLRQLIGDHDSAVQIVGAAYVDGAKSMGRGNVCGVPVYSGYRNLTEALVQIPFDEVLINAPDRNIEDLEDMVVGFEEMGVDCHFVLRVPASSRSLTRIETFKGYHVITYTMNRSSFKKLLIKRLFDIIGGLVGLALTGILCIFLIPAIKLDSKGPVFFSQTRVGKNGRRFKIYKFRSMYVDAENRLKDLSMNNEMDGLMFKMEDDPRVTRVGRFIRKTSLDEFPQFLNVLKGDMSLVGTRPPTETEFEQYNEYYRRRLQMTPGLTGMWQVSGRNDITDFDEVVRLDLYYIDHWSLSLDFKILLKTVAVLFTHKGAK